MNNDFGSRYSMGLISASGSTPRMTSIGYRSNPQLRPEDEMIADLLWLVVIMVIVAMVFLVAAAVWAAFFCQGSSSSPSASDDELETARPRSPTHSTTEGKGLFRKLFCFRLCNSRGPASNPLAELDRYFAHTDNTYEINSKLGGYLIPEPMLSRPITPSEWSFRRNSAQAQYRLWIQQQYEKEFGVFGRSKEQRRPSLVQLEQHMESELLPGRIV